ncbi:adhesion G-protein coupled receptor G1 isoform X2 [Melanotaenia boesemani]|uniref:adhesion G-protein coupled receptor G1 isoform X2 n=1 Tax=Melanotaenia boesemani TaxID=1250792 RepID=UPI001C04A6FE|nr:adhesion G-protein coupled receptor G1 isoform X2 [Melanotaenia boesemani]
MKSGDRLLRGAGSGNLKLLLMEAKATDPLKTALFIIILLSTVSGENDLYLNFCGTWRHGQNPLSLNISLSTGCSGIIVSANRSSLSISGKITARCSRSDVIPLNSFGLNAELDSDFCLYWEPLLDQLKLEVGGKNLTLCWPASPKDSCCTDLSNGPNADEAKYGIVNGKIKNDTVTDKTLTAYNFTGQSTDYDKLCKQANKKYFISNEASVMSPPCSHRLEFGLKDVTSKNITSSATPGSSSEPAATVRLPTALKEALPNTSKVVITFFKENSLFQDGYKKAKPINDVVEITVENEVIANLSEPIRIIFNHDDMPIKRSRKCVSWDTAKDSLLVNWLVDGCETHKRGAKQTECQCNHLTYFTVLVELKAQPVRHLLALTAITSLGCAVSFISCIALIVLLCRKRRRSKDQSSHIHMGLAVSLAFLSLLFFFTGVLANVGGESVCTWIGPILHYTLLSTFTWMGIEVFHTFWLVYMVFNLSPKPYVWNLIGFILPVIPVIILVAVGDIYGLRMVVPSDDVNNPYMMCWMKENDKALLAHYFTNMTALAVLVLSGTVMLFLVYLKIRIKDDWKKHHVAFLSIWGLSCLFGTTWGLALLNVEMLSDLIQFLFCIFNSFQGFFLMLRFCMLDWMRKQADGSVLGSTSSGSTRQHMLQCQEKS